MCVKENRKLTWTLMLLLLSGALYSDWKVDYQQPHICAVRNSTVVILCLFYYPDPRRVEAVMWGHERSHLFIGPFLFESNENRTSSKFEYIGDRKQNCSLKIHKVEQNDAGKYAFRFVTDLETGKMTGVAGSTLTVVDLKVLSTSGNGIVKEGDSVNLTCKNDCDDDQGSSVFTWFKNRKPTNEGRVLTLSNVSSTNTGNYTCSLRANAGIASRVININVEHGPKNTSVSVRPSMAVDAGSNNTLICSSHANPPVESFIWFKIEDDNIVDVGHQPVLFSGDGGRYFCSASNKHGSQNSSVVTVREHGTTFDRHTLILPGAAFLVVIVVYFAIRYKKKKTRGSETHCEEDVQDITYVNWPVFDNNQSQEGNHKDDGATSELIYTMVDLTTRTEQGMDSHDDHGQVIYSTVCK